jgi:RNA polymerase sigma-70 factor (ECF subfamily)
MIKAGNLASAHPTIMTSSMALVELYETHYAAVYRTAARITGNSADAEDVLQTVFLRVLAQEEPAASRQLTEAYFKRAAANAAIDILRRKTTHAEIQLNNNHLRLCKEPAALLKEQLRRAIASLNQEDASIFLLRYVEGLTNGELAELYQQEKNAVAVRLHRIRQTLQAEMER